jgi:hypothetical protein
MVALSALPMNIAQQLKEASTFLPGKFQRALQNSSALEGSVFSLSGLGINLRIKQSLVHPEILDSRMELPAFSPAQAGSVK